MSKGKAQFWVSRDDGLRIPTKWNPAREAWHKDYHQKVVDTFGH